MKIGILTYFYGANYGAKAQAYALQKTIQSLGHQCFMIDFRAEGYKKLNLSMNLNVKHMKFHPFLLLHCLIRCHRFSKANSMYNLTPVITSAYEMEQLNLDYIVFGSDAIFNVCHKSFNDVYMGVGISKTKKVAYAPSCENLSPDYKLSNDCINSLKAFVKLSVRDINTQKLIYSNMGVKPQLVCDPTLLYGFNDISSTWNEKNYILAYTFSPWDEYYNQFREFARETGLKIISIGRSCKWSDKNYDMASFDEWICSFRNAEYVITDSFHGTVFAIKNSKQTIICSRNDKRDKIQSLISDAGTMNTFYTGEESVLEHLNHSHMNYKEISTRITELQKKSLAYLDDNLK